VANAFFALGREKFLNGSIDWTNDSIKIVLVDEGTDTPVPATDEFLSDITAGARIATSGNLGTKTSTGGTADAADVTFTAVTGNSVESFVLYKDTGTPSTSPLIAYFDTVSAGLPVTPNGGDITITFDAAGIFTL
jgi:hypothetical protein